MIKILSLKIASFLCLCFMKRNYLTRQADNKAKKEAIEFYQDKKMMDYKKRN